MKFGVKHFLVAYLELISTLKKSPFLKWCNNSSMTFDFRHTLALAAHGNSMGVVAGSRVVTA